MGKYKIKYTQESARIMIVEASSEEEAKQKYEDFECIEVFEEYGISEELGEIIKVEE